MSMRRPNQEWMDAMEVFLMESIQYLTQERLWAHQGGPIILGQVENELGSDEIDPKLDHVITRVDSSGTLRNATMKDYADWCGATAAKYAPDVLWTMCNGLTAPNAINTCNGYGGVSCSQGWLEYHGQSGRIQVDQPAMWTENEGGFQVWGETPSQSSYFWGRTARDFARDGLKWFARGGTHMNYYMFWGGCNRGRQAAGGITNMYANEAMLCPSGEPRHPKYDHLQAFHKLLIDLASSLLVAPSALLENQTICVLSKSGMWEMGKEQRMFSYVYGFGNISETADDGDKAREIVFVENDSPDAVVALVNLPHHGNKTVEMSGLSGIILVNGLLRFDSSTIDPQMKAFRRSTIESPVELLNWELWNELIGVDPLDSNTIISDAPVEQTELLISSRVSSQYVWYETEFRIPSMQGEITNTSILIDTQKASAMNVYIDGRFIGWQSSPQHEEGNVTFVIEIGRLVPAKQYKLAVLSENFGYGNLIGRWGFSSQAKTKGLTGRVKLSLISQSRRYEFDLVDGREWLSFPGLHGPASSRPIMNMHRTTKLTATSPAVWLRATFGAPPYDETCESLFLDISTGRGHIWLNGHDLGMYWNITRGDVADYSQRYYMLPFEYVYTTGRLNELLIFNTLGGDHASTRLVISGMKRDETASLDDVVDHPYACM